MRTAYDILLSLTLNHLYFSDKVFENFELIPDKKTKRLINDLRLLPKKQKNNWSLFFQTEGPFATTHELLINKEFFFTLNISDPFFYNITSDDYLHEKGKMFSFNSPLNLEIVPEKRKIVPEEREVLPIIFNYTIHEVVRPVNIKVIDYKGKELINDVVIESTVKEKKIDLTESGENIYNISEDTVPASNLLLEKIYAKEVINDDLFYGTVYFKVLSIDADPLANQYEINFETTV